MKWVVTTGGNGVIVEAETAFPSPSGVLLFYRRLAPDEPSIDLDGDAPALKPGARRGRFGPKKSAKKNCLVRAFAPGKWDEVAEATSTT